MLRGACPEEKRRGGEQEEVSAVLVSRQGRAVEGVRDSCPTINMFISSIGVT